MRLGIMSDTHGHKAYTLRAIERMGDVDAYIHLGDGVLDTRLIEAMHPDRPIYCVQGNRDGPNDAPEELLITLGGTAFLLVHGDRYRVGFSLDRLVYKALDAKARMVLYGHTHRANHAHIEGIELYNPGSVGQPRDGRAAALVLEGDGTTGWTPTHVDLTSV